MLTIAQLAKIKSKDAYLYDTLRQLVQGYNQLSQRLGLDGIPNQQSIAAQQTPSFAVPLPPAGISVSGGFGIFTITLTPNPANSNPIYYFVESSTTSTFINPSTYSLGNALGISLNLPNQALYWRARAKYLNSNFSSYVVFGAPQQVSSGGGFTGSGNVVLSNSPAITGLNLTTPSSNETVTLLNWQGPLGAITGNGSDQAIYSWTLPANTLGAGKGLRVTFCYIHSTGLNSVSYRMRFGGTDLETFSYSPANNTSVDFFQYWIFNNPNSTSAQTFCRPSIVNYSGEPANSQAAFASTGTAAINTTVDQPITYTFNVASTDAITPKFWSVELVQ